MRVFLRIIGIKFWRYSGGSLLFLGKRISTSKYQERYFAGRAEMPFSVYLK